MAKTNKSDGVGRVYTRPNSPSLWLYYCHNGKVFRRTANTDSIKEANRKLQDLIKEVGQGSYRGGKSERIKVQELADDLIRDYKINGKKSLPDVESRWKLHLKDFFAHYRANDVSTSLVARYIDKRQTENAANGTINRELAALKRAFNLALQSTPPKVNRVPYIPHLAEDNVRTGFLEQHQYEKLADYFAGVGLWMRAIFEVGFSYGWRREEVLRLKVKQVDLLNRIIRLETGSTKNKKGRIVTMTDKVFELLKLCCEGKGQDDFVFTRFLNGRHKHVVDFRDVWANGCKAASCVGLLFHDLRRTAARGLVRAGVAPHHAAKITGHKTLSVFNRYDIVDERDIADAVQKLERHQTEQKLAQSLHTAPKDDEAQPVRVGLTN
jgi:integrase